MINVQPSAPRCVMATCVRVEIEAEDIENIRAELGLDADATITLDHLTEHTLAILNAHYLSRGAETKRLSPLPL